MNALVFFLFTVIGKDCPLSINSRHALMHISRRWKAPGTRYILTYIWKSVWYHNAVLLRAIAKVERLRMPTAQELHAIQGTGNTLLLRGVRFFFL